MGTKTKKPIILSWYDRTVLGRPVIALFFVALLVCIAVSHTNQFRLDASSDSLLLENDQSLAYFRTINAIYGSNDYLIITYTPKEELFANGVITDLQQLHNQLSAIERIDSITSILNVPLIESPPITLSDVAKNIITL